MPGVGATADSDDEDEDEDRNGSDHSGMGMAAPEPGALAEPMPLVEEESKLGEHAAAAAAAASSSEPPVDPPEDAEETAARAAAAAAGAFQSLLLRPILRCMTSVGGAPGAARLAAAECLLACIQGTEDFGQATPLMLPALLDRAGAGLWNYDVQGHKLSQDASGETCIAMHCKHGALFPLR